MADMNANTKAFSNVSTLGDGTNSPCIQSVPDAPPDVSVPNENTKTEAGVSPDYATNPHENTNPQVRHWYALRTTYGREQKAYDYFVEHHIEAYCPTYKGTRVVRGREKITDKSYIPNIFFARGTEEEMESFVRDSIPYLPYLRFCYRYFHRNNRPIKEPLIVPDSQMDSFRIICSSGAEDIIVSSTDIPKFKLGQTVRVIDGPFKGLIGKVARFRGQQRVGIAIDGFLSVASSYIPSAFLEHLN